MLRPLRVINLLINAPIATKMVIQKIVVLRLWGILNGGIIIVIQERRSPTKSQLQLLLNQTLKIQLLVTTTNITGKALNIF